jgi:hypothetical protein
MGYKELVVSADHMVGKFKYVIGENSKGEKGPCQVYIDEAQLNVTKAYEENEDGFPISGVVSVVTKYKVHTHKHTFWVKEKDLYDTKDDVLRVLEWKKKAE